MRPDRLTLWLAASMALHVALLAAMPRGQPRVATAPRPSAPLVVGLEAAPRPPAPADIRSVPAAILPAPRIEPAPPANARAAAETGPVTGGRRDRPMPVPPPEASVRPMPPSTAAPPEVDGATPPAAHEQSDPAPRETAASADSETAAPPAERVGASVTLAENANPASAELQQNPGTPSIPSAPPPPLSPGTAAEDARAPPPGAPPTTGVALGPALPPPPFHLLRPIPFGGSPGAAIPPEMALAAARAADVERLRRDRIANLEAAIGNESSRWPKPPQPFSGRCGMRFAPGESAEFHCEPTVPLDIEQLSRSPIPQALAQLSDLSGRTAVLVVGFAEERFDVTIQYGENSVQAAR